MGRLAPKWARSSPISRPVEPRRAHEGVDDLLQRERGVDGQREHVHDVGDRVAVFDGFFAFWGVGALVVTFLADWYGRKPALAGCLVGALALSAASAAAQSFAVYAACRAVSGVFVGAIGGVSFVLCVEWALPKDNAAISALLMVGWSVVAACAPWLMALTDAHEATSSWRFSSSCCSAPSQA